MIAARDVIALGPGLGQDDWAQTMFDPCWRSERPTVVDADALNLLARCAARERGDWVLTPHPGEAGRLLGADSGRGAARSPRRGARDRSSRYGGVVVLKGAGTLVVTRQAPPCDLRSRQSRHGVGRHG